MKPSNPTLSDIAGRMCERSVWQLLDTLAAAGVCPSPECITVEDDRYVLAPGSRTADAFRAPEGDSPAWSFGAVAFYALMGVPVFEGTGGRGQSADTPVPSIGAAHCSAALSGLLRRALSYEPAQRPTVEEIAAAARGALAAEPAVPPRLSHPDGKQYASSMVRFWPDEMLPLIVAVILSLGALHVSARTLEIPAQMQTLVERCRDLRSPANAQKVSRQFMRDAKWTLMDELPVDRAGECTVRDKVGSFGFNDMGFRIAKMHSGVTTHSGRFRNGADPRYNYSLIEITVKKGATVSYPVSGRSGAQVFAVVPLDPAAPFTAMLTAPDGTRAEAVTADGVCYLDLDCAVAPADNLTLTVTNRSGANMAYVLINYNSRK